MTFAPPRTPTPAPAPIDAEDWFDLQRELHRLTLRVGLLSEQLEELLREFALDDAIARHPAGSRSRQPAIR